MPKPTHTPLRNVRVNDELWELAQRGAEAEGSNVSAVITGHLRDRYVKGVPSQEAIHQRLDETRERLGQARAKSTMATLQTEIDVLEWVLGIPDPFEEV